MNTKSVVTILTILLLTASLSFADGPRCSTKSVAGDWGLYTPTSTILLPTGAAPAAAVVSASVDRDRERYWHGSAERRWRLRR